jgi:hypothetical protein
VHGSAPHLNALQTETQDTGERKQAPPETGVSE